MITLIYIGNLIDSQYQSQLNRFNIIEGAKQMYNPQQTLKQTIILGIYFMLTYTTYLSFANIITYIAEHQEGQYSYGPLVALASNYSVYFVTLIFSSAITNFKKQFQISAICHLINYLVYIPDFKGDLGLVVGIVGAVFGGYGAAIYWVSQGGYMMKLFKTYKIKQNQEGKYFGIVNAIVYFSCFFGAVVTTFGLGIFGIQIYFIILSVLSVVSWAVCTFFLDSLDRPNQQGASLLTESPSSVTEHETNQKMSAKLSSWQIIKQTFLNTLYYYPKMYYLWLPIIFEGFIASFVSSYLSKIIPEHLRSNLNVGYMLMILGIGCTIGAFLSASLSDRISVLNLSKFGMLIICLCAVLTYINDSYQFQQLYFPYFVAFWWGFIINYIMSLQSVSCAKINKGNLYSFSIARQISALAFIGFTIFMIANDNQLNVMYFMIMMVSMSFVSLFVVTIFETSQRKVTLIIEEA